MSDRKQQAQQRGIDAKNERQRAKATCSSNSQYLGIIAANRAMGRGLRLANLLDSRKSSAESGKSINTEFRITQPTFMG